MCQRDNPGDLYAFTYPAPESHRHFIPKARYAGEVRPRGLAQCVKDWIALLTPFDAQMGPTRRAPSSVIAVRRKRESNDPDLDEICTALACAVAMRERIDDPVVVALCASTDFETLTQAEPDRLTLSWKSDGDGIKMFGRNPGGLRQDASLVPDISGIDFRADIPGWRSVVDLFPTERRPASVTRSGGSTVAGGSFAAGGLSAHERVRAMRVLTTLLESDLSPLVRGFLRSVPEYWLSPRPTS